MRKTKPGKMPRMASDRCRPLFHLARSILNTSERSERLSQAIFRPEYIARPLNASREMIQPTSAGNDHGRRYSGANCASGNDPGWQARLGLQAVRRLARDPVLPSPNKSGLCGRCATHHVAGSSQPPREHSVQARKLHGLRPVEKRKGRERPFLCQLERIKPSWPRPRSSPWGTLRCRRGKSCNRRHQPPSCPERTACS